MLLITKAQRLKHGAKVWITHRKTGAVAIKGTVDGFLWKQANESGDQEDMVTVVSRQSPYGPEKHYNLSLESIGIENPHSHYQIFAK